MPEPERNHRLTIAYVGTRYHGWQIQPGASTIQGILEDLLAEIYQTRICLAGAGRTDAGVHALGQVANFFAPPQVPISRLPLALNTRLPEDIRVQHARLAADSFHARKSARSKIYRFQIFTGPYQSPFLAPFHHFLPRPLDVSAMAQAARAFLGRHDFTSFCAHAAGERNRERTVFSSAVIRHGHRVLFQVEADGFLHHMVRNMAGTLLEIGSGRRDAASIPALLAARDRRLAAPTAPARGLFLVKVRYRWRKDIP